MLKKIKKFKINLRPSFVERAAKKKLGLDHSDSSIEKPVLEEIERFKSSVVPSALYETLSKRQLQGDLSMIWGQASSKAISVSFAAVTIGKNLEELLQKETDPFKQTMIESIAWEGVDQAANFVYRLLGEEAKLEACENSPFIPVPQEQLAAVLQLLDGEKAGIVLNGESIDPLYSKLVCCFQVPVLKRK